MCFVASGWSRQGAGLSRRRFLGAGLAGAVSATVLGTGKLAGAQSLPRQAASGLSGVVALTGATVYPGPDAPPIQRGVVVVRDRRIVAVGSQGEVVVPGGVRILDCSGLSVTAGFSNCHVHFMGPKWQDADADGRHKVDPPAGTIPCARNILTVRRGRLPKSPNPQAQASHDRQTPDEDAGRASESRIRV
jgi:hypothetical protein